jgi:cytochrome b561
MWKNTAFSYGRITKLLHWMSALTIFTLFGLGIWMVDLTYYSQWYKTAPHWHRSLGVLLFLATIFRLFWRWHNQAPTAIDSHSNRVKQAATAVHIMIYVLLISLMITGYLISTADPRAINMSPMH